MATEPARLRVSRDNLVPLPVLAPYFLLGLLSFSAAPLPLFLAAPALEAGAYRHPFVLAAVHLYALGWGTAIALGALQQLSPVLAASRLYSPLLARIGFGAFLLGLVSLLTGFFTLRADALVSAAALLPFGIVLPLVNAVLTQRQAPMTRQGLFVRPSMLSAAVYLVLTAGAGALLAAHLGRGWLGEGWSRAFASHVTLGTVGWFLMLVSGVSYHLLPFFGLTEKKRPPRGLPLVRRLLHGAVLLLIGAAVARGPFLPAKGSPGALLLLAAALLVFLGEHGGLFAPRPPERMHPIVGYVRAAHVYLALGALGALAAAVLSFGPPSLQLSPTGIVFLGWLMGAGWLSNTILGYLHRILPFYVWHNKYWDRSKEPGVPAFRAMVNTRVAWIAFALYNAGVILVLAALVTPLPLKPALVLWGLGGAMAAGNVLWVFRR